MRRLSLDTLAALPAAVARPTYDARSIGVGIVHLGIGAFHRAQTAVFSDDALALDHGVRITGATVHLVTSDLDAGSVFAQVVEIVSRKRAA